MKEQFEDVPHPEVSVTVILLDAALMQLPTVHLAVYVPAVLVVYVVPVPTWGCHLNPGQTSQGIDIIH